MEQKDNELIKAQKEIEIAVKGLLINALSNEKPEIEAISGFSLYKYIFLVISDQIRTPVRITFVWSFTGWWCQSHHLLYLYGLI